ncbi:MAG: STN domain-containing protein [Cytophagaceae bacterium]|nr:STN domain-containing protein [Cytophagaceae bacterium]
MKLRLLVLISVVLFSGKSALAQSPLERRVSVRLDNTRLSDALSALARQGDFNFSYASTLFDGNRRIDLVVASKPVREVLDQLFRGSLRYKNRGN